MDKRKEKIQASKTFKCKPKEIKEIKFKTPERNEVEGYISYALNNSKGAIFTKKVNGEPNEHIIYNMPKLHYFGDSSPFYNERIDFRSKEDGTNITFCALMNSEKTEVIEAFPRNRRILTEKDRVSPVIGNEFMNTLSTIDTKKYYDFIYDYGGSISFELFGNNNPIEHEINYPNTDLDMRFLFGYDQNGFTYSNDILNEIEEKEKFKRPDKVFDLELEQGSKLSYHLEPTIEFIEKYDIFIDDTLDNILLDNEVRNAKEIYQLIRTIYGTINEASQEKGYGYIGEGCVWTGHSKDDKNVTIQIKNKPLSIERLHAFPHGIPSVMIKKSLTDFIENNPNNIKAYLSKPNTVVEYISNDLKEDILSEKVDNSETQNKIKEIINDYYSKKLGSPELRKIVKKFVSENNNLTIPDLMKKFSEEYPEKAMYSSKVYAYSSYLLS